MRSLAYVIPLFVVGLLACGGGTSSQDMSVAQDLKAAAPDMAKIDSICGMPGDTGNSIGVGKFCTSFSDCAGNSKATICSQIGDPKTYFCTFLCDKMGMSDQCGENATCVCMMAGCGCTPNKCLGSTDGGAGG